MVLALSLLLSLAFQTPAPPPLPVPQPAPQEPALWSQGGIEAPAQPSQSSQSTYTKGPRVERAPGRGTAAGLFAPIGSLVEVRGQEDNELVGVGLVTGLAGTGDSANMTRQLLENLLLVHNIKVDRQQLTPKNIALVRIEATLPAGMQPGRALDVRVSTLGDAKSLQGGTLAFSELTDVTGAVVYATASGPVNVGGFLAEGAGASASKNHVTVGSIPGGGKVERAVPSELVSEHGFLYLDARAAHASYANLVRIAEAVNELYPGAAEPASDSRTVKVRVPRDLPQGAHMAYLDSILRREVLPDGTARVVVNERTGTIVMGEGVRLRAGAIARGDLTVTIAETPEVSQPGPLSQGRTAVVDRTTLGVAEENNGLTYVPGAATLQEVVEVLNVLGTTPRDLIGILEAMHQAGLLLAQIQRM